MNESEESFNKKKVRNLGLYRKAVEIQQREYEKEHEPDLSFTGPLRRALNENARLQATTPIAKRILNRIVLLLEKAKRDGKTSVTIKEVDEAMTKKK